MNATNSSGNEIEKIFELYRIPPDYLRHRSVYVSNREPGFILKPLTIGTVRAFLTGSLLTEGEECPLIPKLLKSPAGGFYFWRRGNRYLFMEKLPGREADYFLTEDLKAAVMAMACFHRFSRKLLAAAANRWSLVRFSPGSEWLKRLREMEVCRERAARLQEESFSRQYLQMWPQSYELAFRAIQSLPAAGREASDVICYHDWAFHNVLINKDRAYLIDFDYMLVDHQVHDRANLISRYLRLHQWSVNSLLKILWIFDRFYPWKRGELKLLGIYLTFPFDFWMLGRQYYLEKQHWSRNYYQDQWERKIGHYQELLRVLKIIENME
ncbi:MAG: hypothetical protein ACM3X9_14255 [Bacillota bacterium]